MSANLLHRLLGGCLALAVLVLFVSAGFAIGAPALGESLITSWPVVTDLGRTIPIAASGHEIVAVINEGTLQARSTAWQHACWRLLDVIVVGGLIVALIESLRRLAGDLRAGRPFGPGAERRLRRCAAFLGGLALWSVVSPMLWAVWLIPDGGSEVERSGWMTLVLDGGERLRLLPEPSWGMAVAALLCLVLGRVFAIGLELQRDSDEVV